jgi:hypothetical protein
MFLHMGIGRPGRWSAGNSLTVVCAVLVATAVLITASFCSGPAGLPTCWPRCLA